MKQAVANLVEKGFTVSRPVKVSKNDWVQEYRLSKYEDRYAVYPVTVYVVLPNHRKFEDVASAVDFFLTLACHPNNLSNFINWQVENGFDPEEVYELPGSKYDDLLKRYYAEYGSEFQNPDAIRFLEVAKAESEASENEDE